jgi:hypothetical protein
MPSPTIHDNLSFLIEVEKKEIRLKSLFRIAARTIGGYELSARELLRDERDAERDFALFWLNVATLQLKDEPSNPLLKRSLADAQAWADTIFQPDDFPWELG